MNYDKYSASGNDFVIFHTFKKDDYSKKAIELCNRTEGIGADGLIVIIPHETLDFEWLFYNSDGSDAAMCGNGTRACAHYAYNNNLANSSMNFMTGAGKISCTVDGDVVESELTPYKIIKEEFEEHGLTWWLVDTGVPHLVTMTDNLDIYSKDIASKMRYKYNANVNYAKVEDEKLYVRTYERGVEDETLACGTGMCASFLRANLLGKLSTSSKVFPKSKEELTISLKDDTLYFKGKVRKVFSTSL